MGRKLGMSGDDLMRLKVLKKDDFPPDEFALLTYVREWTFAGGEAPQDWPRQEVEEYFNQKEIRYFHKLMHMMIFANYFSLRFLTRKKSPSCPMPGYRNDTGEEKN